MGISILHTTSNNAVPLITEAETRLEDKFSPDLATRLEVSTNPDESQDVIADLHSSTEWSDAKNAILQVDPYARIRAYHNLIHAISLRTTVRGVQLLAGIDAIRKIWVDTKTQLSSMVDSDLQALKTSTLTKYIQPQDVVSTTPLTAQGFNGSHIVVAILDTGIDASHPDLDDFDDNETTNDPKVLGQVSFAEGDPFPFDLNGHGTYCAGLIAGTGTASGKYTGIAPGAHLLSAKVLLANGTGYTSWVIRGIEWSLTRGADIILMPFSTFGMPGDPLSQSIRESGEQGVLVVAAAGDDGPNHMTIMSPGESIAALTVGAYDSKTGGVAEFSSRGPTFDMRIKPDLVAPGVNIISCSLYDIIPIDLGEDGLSSEDISSDMFGFGGFGQSINENYTKASTTAAAAAIAAGAACLLLQTCRFATPECLTIAMCEGAQSLKGEPTTEGHGLLNASAAYDELSMLHDPIDPTFRARTVTPGLPYYGLVMSVGEAENVTVMMSTYTTAMAAIIFTNTTNMTITHLLMGMFFLAVGNDSPTLFALLDVEQEMHWTTLPNANYTRTTGILSYGDLLIIPRIESWRITSEPFANAFRFTFFLLNIGDEDFEDVRIFSLWNFDLFLGVNDTSTEVGAFNSTEQFFQVEADAMPPNETALVNQSIGFNTITPLDSFEVGPYNDVYDHLQEDALNGSDSYTSEEGVGVGTGWNLGDIPAGAPVTNVTMTLGFGNSTAALVHGINETKHATLDNPQPDLCVIRPHLPRTGLLNSTYHTSALVLNIGDEVANDAIAAFLTNRTQHLGGTIFTRYFQFTRIDVFQAIFLEVDWRPEVSEIFLASWLVSPDISFNLYNLTLPEDHYPLDNAILRDVFISSPPLMRLVTPSEMPYAPMTLQFPNDYALYNVTLLTSTVIEHLQISLHGNAADWINLTETTFEDITLGTSFQLMIIIPAFLAADTYIADIRFSANDGWTTTIRLRVDVIYPKALILFDAAHNLALNITDTENLANLDLEELFEAFDEMSDSILTGYSRVRDLFASASLNLMELPYSMELNSTILSAFDGLLICDPEQAFSTTEALNMSQYIADGFKVLILPDNADETNHTALNQLLFNHDIQLAGPVAVSNTTDLLSTSPFTRGIERISVGNGTTLQLGGSAEAFAWVNGTPVGAYQHSSHRELYVFGCSAAFSNGYIKRFDNEEFANKTIHYLFRKTVEITVHPTGGNGSVFTLNQHAGFFVDVKNSTGHGVEGLEMYCIYQLANGSELFFVVFEVTDGRYGTFIFSNWTGGITEDSNTFTIIVFTMPSNYSSSMAFLRFTYIEAPEEPPPQPEPDYILFMTLQIVIACVIFLVVLLAYVTRQVRRRRRMRTPSLDEQVIRRIDNALNTTHALIRELEWILTSHRLDRLDKLRFIDDEMSSRLNRTLQTLRELAKEAGVES